MPRFITLAGRKQVGKDTSAGMIKELLVPIRTEKQPNGCMDALFEEGPYAGHVHVVHFADALKEACVTIFGISRRDMETEEGKQKVTEIKWPMSQLRQTVPGVHEYETVGYAPHHPQAGKPKFMTVREVLQFVGTELFRNQLDPDIWVQSVYRRGYGERDVVIVADCRFPNEAKFGGEHGLLLSIERETGLAGDSHASETSLDGYEGYHHILQNNGSFEDLKAQLRVVLETEGFLS